MLMQCPSSLDIQSQIEELVYISIWIFSLRDFRSDDALFGISDRTDEPLCRKAPGDCFFKVDYVL